MTFIATIVDERSALVDYHYYHYWIQASRDILGSTRMIDLKPAVISRAFYFIGSSNGERGTAEASGALSAMIFLARSSPAAFTRDTVQF